MSSDLKKVNRELLEDFIRAYQSQPCLWRIKSKDCHDKAKRDAAYDILLKKYRLIDVNADKDAVVKKINAFRTNYRREKRKVEESRHSGIGTDEIYEPSLWYYHLFDFLGDQDTPRSSSSNLNEIEVSFIYCFVYKHTFCLFLYIYLHKTYLFIYLYKTSIHKCLVFFNVQSFVAKALVLHWQSSS